MKSIREIIDLHCDDIVRYSGATSQWRDDLIRALEKDYIRKDSVKYLTEEEILKTMCHKYKELKIITEDFDVMQELAKSLSSLAIPEVKLPEKRKENIGVYYQDTVNYGFNKAIDIAKQMNRKDK